MKAVQPPKASQTRPNGERKPYVQDSLVNQSYFDATHQINQLSSFNRVSTDDLSRLHFLQQQLAVAESQAIDSEDVNLATKIGIARHTSELSVQKRILINDRTNERLGRAFQELFALPAFHNLANLAEWSLEEYVQLEHGKYGGRVQMSGTIHELTALLIAYDPEDPLKFAVPSSAYDDQKSSGFHFDLMLYDLNQKKDIRRGIDMKSRRTKFNSEKISKFARTTFSDEVLHNGTKAEIWENTDYAQHGTFRTLHALIDASKGDATPETIAILAVIRDEFYRQQFSGHRKEFARKIGTQTLTVIS